MREVILLAVLHDELSRLRAVTDPHGGDLVFGTTRGRPQRPVWRVLPDAEGRSRPLVTDGVMAVSTYNAQRPPDGMRVGTVDECQGQEAAVTVFPIAALSCSATWSFVQPQGPCKRWGGCETSSTPST